MNRETLLADIERFPDESGIYLMKDGAGEILYIGKARNLRLRVRSYFFDAHEERPHIPVMLRRLVSIEFIATATETDALILESNLVKRHKPQFNVLLRDDKHFPYLKITTTEPFPRLLVVRKVLKDGNRYFGPYTDSSALKRLMVFAHRIFRLRDCSHELPLKTLRRPCINYSMGRCSGACAGKISVEDYNARINQLIAFLQGRRSELQEQLKERMAAASAQMRFEEAAMFRDQIALISDASRSQRVDLKIPDARSDVFGIFAGDRHVCLCILHFREGLLLSNRNFVFNRSVWEDADHDSVVLQFYLEVSDLPDEILFSKAASFDVSIIASWFKSERKVLVDLHVPLKGVKKQLVDMATRNAELYLAQKHPQSGLHDCEDLARELALPHVPSTIEAFDIANLGPAFAVAGMVRFTDGLPDRKHYRTYKIRSVNGQNDFAMMMEVVTRRLARLRDEGQPFPDLILADGGLGQLGSAAAALALFENPPMLISLAKQEELLFSPHLDHPVALAANHPARKLVQRIRDEVHRVANSFHKKVRDKQFKRSVLEEIEGIGQKRAADLLRKFGSLKRVKEASVDDLIEKGGIGQELAQRIITSLS